MELPESIGVGIDLALESIKSFGKEYLQLFGELSVYPAGLAFEDFEINKQNSQPIKNILDTMS